MGYRAAIPLVCVFVGLLLMNLFPGLQPVEVTTAASTTGYLDMPFYYKPLNASAPLVQTPTGEKPQSKLWYNDGRWWASLFNTTSGNYHIYWLNLTYQTWIDTGTVLDTRAETKADCLWDGTYLYVVSGGGADLSGAGTRYPWPAVLYRFSYNAAAKSYTPDFGPITVRDGGAETIVLDKDTTGKLWVTYTQNNKVYVNHSLASDSDWNPAAAMVVPTTDPKWTSLSPDDISSLVAFDGKIGVIWSNESPGQFAGSSDTAFYFAYHVDGTADAIWSSRAIYRQPSAADDHINIKSLQADPAGNIYAMVKTSFNAVGSPQLLLLVAKKQSGTYTWTPYVESVREDKQTRPILLIDTENRKLYVFTSTESGGYIYYKSTSLSTIQFSPGPGTLFMTKNGYALNNLTSTKQTVNSGSGIVVMASHDNEAQVDNATLDYYFHNHIAISPVVPVGTATPTATARPATPTATATATPLATPTATATPRPYEGGTIYIPLMER